MSATQPRGVVTAARAEAAAAGASILRAGGNAADAAIATAFALAVTDPANCGIGGYGGFAVVSEANGNTTQINFNTHVPVAFNEASMSSASRRGAFLYGAASVSPPAVVPGLKCLHETSGSLDWAELVSPAVALADKGFVVGPDLAAAISWAFRSERYLSPALRDLLGGAGQPLRADDRLVQRDLAETLRAIAADGPQALLTGPCADKILSSLGQMGALSADEFGAINPSVRWAERVTFYGSDVFGGDCDETGFGVVRDVLEDETFRWPRTRDRRFATAMSERLHGAWRRRDARFHDLSVPAKASVQHTTHLCAADASGLIVSLTFTHGPLWFGSAILAPETGVTLNCGANLFVEEHKTGQRRSQTNVCPIIIRRGDGSCIAFGTPGGRKIPAMAVALAVDVLVRGDSVEAALAHPRISVGFDGTPEVEDPLAQEVAGSRVIARDDFYGPASAIEGSSDATLRGYTDPRFAGAVATA